MLNKFLECEIPNHKLLIKFSIYPVSVICIFDNEFFELEYIIKVFLDQ